MTKSDAAAVYILSQDSVFDDLVDDLSSRMCMSSSLCVDCHVFKQCFTLYKLYKFLSSVIVTDTDMHSMTFIRC